MRIVAGRFRGRSLRAPRGSGTRPTSDKVREALFSTLFDVENFEVLDLFAGSGAIGLEALSRGARRATFVERDRQALLALEANIEALGLSPDEALVLGESAASALRNLAAEGARFDLIFADPPYREASVVLPEVATLAGPLLPTYGRLVVEHATRDVIHETTRSSTRSSSREATGRAPRESTRGFGPDAVSALSDIPGLACTSRRRYGDTTLSYYAREEPHGGEGPSRSHGTSR